MSTPPCHRNNSRKLAKHCRSLKIATKFVLHLDCYDILYTKQNQNFDNIPAQESFEQQLRRWT